MIEEFISRSFILALGYAYPAFLCFKTLEKNKVGIQELRFWCQYWTIVAVLAVLEIFSDIFISWLPMYRVMKLAIYIYLWHPSTKGTEYVYDILLRPYMLRYEMDIDRSVFEAKERALNLAIYYWQDCMKLGSKWVLQMFQFVVSQSAAIRQPTSHQLQSAEKQQPNMSPPPASTKTFSRAVSDLQPNVAPTSTKTFSRTVSELRRPPAGPSAPTLSKLPKAESMKLRVHSQAQFIHAEDIRNSEPKQNRVLEEKLDSQHGDAVRIIKSQ